jgi:uncharacterized protein (TIGR02646 family)
MSGIIGNIIWNMKSWSVDRKRSLFRRQNGICHYCGRKMKISEFSVEHVLPTSRGGSNSWRNLVGACIECNHAKANMTLEEFMSWTLAKI